MNLRWLFFNYTDPQYKLSRADQKRLTMKAPTGISAWHMCLIMLALFVVMIGGFKLVDSPLQTLLMMLGVPSTTGFLPIIIWIGFVWVASAWACRFIYIKAIRRAMREEGYVLCINCGYDLRGADHESCPECGEDIQKASPV